MRSLHIDGKTKGAAHGMSLKFASGMEVLHCRHSHWSAAILSMDLPLYHAASCRDYIAAIF